MALLINKKIFKEINKKKKGKEKVFRISFIYNRDRKYRINAWKNDISISKVKKHGKIKIKNFFFKFSRQ